jgi:predicted  nucleic acid-binding Zn-ribbon protein
MQEYILKLKERITQESTRVQVAEKLLELALKTFEDSEPEVVQELMRLVERRAALRNHINNTLLYYQADPQATLSN